MCGCSHDDHLFKGLIPSLNAFTAIRRDFPGGRSLAVAAVDHKHLLCACRDGRRVMRDGCYLKGVLISPRFAAVSCHQSPLNGVTHLITMTTACPVMSLL